MADQFEKMDKMYRHQRYFYDLTRKYYLLGRDRMLREISVKDGANILEIGCGTGRNLIILAEKYPQARFYGLDASAEMLKTARAKIKTRNLENITLVNALADDFSHAETFDLREKFDAIFFSYSITMIPPWRAAIENALRNLKSGKSFYIVDFYDQKDLPVWFQKILQKWLEQFHVVYPQELLPFLKDLEARGLGKLTVKNLYRRYSILAEFKKI
ncbi:MAG: class I SAM-dependent methyltransferase [Pyrinomonadaceae bacterium]